MNKTFEKIIVINDGNNKQYEATFNSLKKKGALVLKHKKNIGKGTALKTAFLECIKRLGDYKSIITVDADGQHKYNDIIKISKKINLGNPKEIILGSRKIPKHSPLRSKLGNSLTKKIFSIITGQKVSDTQTGLRAIQIKYLKEILLIPGTKYEYEFNMLLNAKSLNFKINEVPIKAIYINKNETSHFRSIKDSFMIYKQIIKYIIEKKFRIFR